METFVRNLFVISMAMGFAACGSSGNPAAPSDTRNGGGSTTTTPPPPPPPPTLSSVAVTTNVSALDRPGATAPATAMGTYSNGANINVTTGCREWFSDNPFALTVNSSGMLTAQNSGSATITTNSTFRAVA